eukprot:CAMPEP_0170592976 /NCGR_PEP_ID=MMETSP0224-20130122/13202_1 /TAXON_ID=285029 /ORGANISM="Togula jolla, Strain CCCM 725" /LENGTH=80 /DNA_ID=CAMNT_0010916899 /DNA_START=1126 /DNA_END=1368 /DNA_ORIENTATION=-
MEVCFHKVRHDVDVVEVRMFGWVHVDNADDVVMFETPKQLHLTQDPLPIYEIMKGISDLLHGELCSGLGILERGDCAVGS